MNKRHFLHAALLAAAAPAIPAARAATPPADGPTVLTLSGALARPNRGALDPALDQLMSKHGLAFDQARSFTFAELAALPAIEIRPTLEYDARVHALRGPLLSTLLEQAGAMAGETTTLVLRAFDGYTVELGAADLRRLSPIVATHIDGTPLPLGGLGPLWAVHDADRIPELAARPLAERFAQCPWGLYSVHVVAAGGR
ncbi:molybdopterin-dependent oxidoreductase [Thauera sp.]|uniref:molybdopterin-dependent oxidoreductase n=1 Tax=Thauera sp. TaxID=1905334 RepID=UPI002B9FC2A0|nr:molybdopterin-dependent oxidoreductase [Thauera sp.]HRP26595.1 molybdopterin-dependent oxidoreductase [Thauera sp.]